MIQLAYEHGTERWSTMLQPPLLCVKSKAGRGRPAGLERDLPTILNHRRLRIKACEVEDPSDTEHAM